MRFLFGAASLVLAILSIAIERASPAPESAVCASLGCRDELLATSMEQRGVTPEGLAALVRQDASNPHIWATYGEYLANAGDEVRADQAFEWARTIGPNLSPVLMRAANFAFGHQQVERGLKLAPVILTQTDEFDDILFSYIDRAGLEAAEVVGKAVPATRRAGRAWARWVSAHGSDADLRATWDWLSREQLADQATAVAFINTLWARHAYGDAQTVWRQSIAKDQTTAQNQLLANVRFERPPLAIPFDWDLSPRAGLEYVRQDGLSVRFTGDTNVSDVGVQQSVVVTPGTYRLQARVRVDGISTDQGVFFLITDVEDPSRFRASTTPLIGTVVEQDVFADLVVPEGTRALQVRLSRTPSLKFDSNLSGTLVVRSIELFSSHP